MSVNLQLDKQAIASSFSKAAPSYDAVASLQRRVGEQLLGYLPLRNGTALADHTGLDLGCGTGYFSTRLQQLSGDDVVGFDLAEGMLSQARACSQGNENTRWLCGDAENLPLQDNSMDWVFSSFALQWCGDIRRAFEESFRVLKRGGYLLLSMPVQGTLMELEKSWQIVDQGRHVNDFISETVIAAQLSEIFGHYPEEKNHELFLAVTETRLYTQLNELLRELKDLGAHNVNRDRSKSLTTKRQYRALLNAYEKYRTEGRFLPASYRLVYACYKKS